MAAVHLPDAVVASSSAVNLSDAAVSSSTGAPTPSPITPIFTPVDIVAVNSVGLSAPVAVSPASSTPINTPIIVTSESISSINTPVIFGSQSSGSVPVPVVIAAESVATVNTPIINTSINQGVVNTPVINTSINQGVVNTPVINTSIDQGVVNTPIINTSIDQGVVNTPVINTSINQGVVNTPVINTSINQGVVNTPIAVAPESDATVDTPVIVTPEPVGAINTPIINTAISQPVIDTPSINPSISVPAYSTPAIVNPIGLPSSNPPYALNHARILYDSVLVGSTVTASGGSNSSLVLVPNTADRWTIPSGESRNILFVMNANTDIDTICIGAHNLGYANASVAAFSSPDSSGATFTLLAPSVSPADDTAIMFHAGAAVSSRRIQVNITAGNSPIFIGSIYAGIALQMQRPFFAGHAPINLSAKTIRYSSMTEGGNFVGEQIRRLGFSTSASFSNLENDWYRFYFQPFVIHARTLPFYFAWNLNQYSTDVGYCKTSEDISPSYGTRDLFNVSFDMVGFG